MKPITAIVTAAGLAALAACETYDPPTSAVTFGEAVRRNVELQVVHPEPPPAVAEPTGLGGHRAALAMARYRTDKVKPPEQIRSTDVGEVGEADDGGLGGLGALLGGLLGGGK